MACLLLLCADEARAGGLYFSDRGVRPMSRGGAFVAGADDLGAIWYNPAGIVDAKTSFLADFTWLRFSNEYTRELRIIDADGVVKSVKSPTVEGSSPVLPLPTIAGSYAIGPDGKLVVAGGLFAPYVALASYDKTINGQPSPARYALGSFDGSALILPGVWVGYKPLDWLQIGAGLHAMVGRFVAEITFSASPQDRLIGAPEQPEFDANAQINGGPIFAPTGNVGLIATPHRRVRVGFAYQHTTSVETDATLKVRLPPSAAFDGARVVGEKATVAFKLPAIIRLGIEVRPVDELRIEVAYAREFWSVHQTIDAVPDGITIEGITAGPPSIAMPTVAVPRGFQDASSYRLGAEYQFQLGRYTFGARAGVSYEQSAVPAAYLSLSSLDFDKTTVGLGGSLYIGDHWRFDMVLAHIFASEVDVRPEEAKIGRINPIQKNAPFESINGGLYSARADLLGLGLQYKF